MVILVFGYGIHPKNITRTSALKVHFIANRLVFVSISALWTPHNISSVIGGPCSTSLPNTSDKSLTAHFHTHTIVYTLDVCNNKWGKDLLSVRFVVWLFAYMRYGLPVWLLGLPIRLSVDSPACLSVYLFIYNFSSQNGCATLFWNSDTYIRFLFVLVAVLLPS